MWLHLFVVLVINSVDAKLRTLEIEKLGSIDNTVFRNIRRNPVVPYVAHHSRKLKTPKMFKLIRTRSEDRMAASRSDYIKNNLWKEPTTETVVPLSNMFQLSERDDISNYMEYLTKMKVFARNIKQESAFKTISYRTNYSSIRTSNIPTPFTSSTSIPAVSKHKHFNKSLHLTRPLSPKITKSLKNVRYRRKNDHANVVDGGADNSINYLEALEENKKNTTAIDDSFLIQGIRGNNATENKTTPPENSVKGNRTTILNYWEKKLNEEHKNLSKRYKMRPKSNNNTTVDTDKLNANHTTINNTYDFPVKSNNSVIGGDDKSKYLRDNERNIHHDSQILYKNPKLSTNESKDYGKDLKHSQLNDKRSNPLMKIFNSETLSRLLQLIPFHDTNVNATKLPSGTNSSSNVTIMLEKDKTKDKALKFVIPKEDLNIADAVLIIFRNLTGKNESRDDMDNVYGEHNSSKTNHTESYNQNELSNSINSQHSESKYKKSKQIVFNAEKKNKLRKFFPDGDIPKKIGTKIILLNKKLSKLNDAQKLFVNNSSKYWLERIINQQIYASNLQVNNNNISSNTQEVKSKLIYFSPIWKLNKLNKSRSPRSTVFRRRYRSPNKFRILVKPTKRNNKLGQVSVHIIRDYEPLEDVVGSLQKYFDNKPPTVKQKKSLTIVQKVKNKTLDTMPNITLTKSDMEVNEIERYLNSYLGLKNMLLAGRLNNSQIKNPQKTSKSDSHQENNNNNNKTDNVNLLHVIKHDNDYNSILDTNQRVKRRSFFSLEPQRNLREVKHVSELRPDRTNSKLYFTKNIFPNLKFYKSNTLPSPHVDQDIYKEYRLAKFFSRLDAVNKSVVRRKKLYNNKKVNKKIAVKSQRSGVKKDFKLNFYKSKSFTVKPKNEFNSLKHIFQRPFIIKGVSKKLPTTVLYFTTKKISNVSSNRIIITTPHPKRNISMRSEYNSSKHILQRSLIRPAIEISKKPPSTELYITTKKKTYEIPNVHQIKPTTARPKENKEFRPPPQNPQYSMIVKKNTSQAPKASLLKNNEFSKTYDITRLSHVIKNSKKRELADFIFFNEHFDFNANEGNNENNHEDTFNDADIGSVGQAGVYEQLEQNDHTDLDVLPVNYKATPFITKKINTYLTYRDLKDTVWVHPEKQTITSSNVPPKRKYVRNNDEPVESVTIGTENADIKGYINLSTARKLYSDLDPLNQNIASDDGVPHSEIDHAVKHREISHPYVHAQLDDYNDEFLRDNNAETNRIGVDYVNYNYEGPDDLTKHRLGKYDKYAGIGFENFASDQNLPRQNVKQAKYILPKVHSWQKIVPDLHSNELSQDELYKYSPTIEKPKRVRPNFDHMNLSKKDKDAPINNDNPNPTDVIKKYYDRNEKRKKMMRLHEKNNTTNNVKKLKKQQTPEKVYMNVPTTTEVISEIFLDNVKVYVHTPAPIEKRKKNILHNSRQLVGLWSKNHMPHNANLIMNAVPLLGIWTHKKRLHTVRPTALEAERVPPEEEFDRRRRKRDVTKRRSQLICILVKRPDQQELVKHVKATWGRRCDVIVLITSKNNKENYLWEFTKAGLGFIYDLNHKNVDWILKADIDSYVVVENLKHMVRDYDPDAPLYFGMLGLSDFSNFVISRGALKVLVTGSKGAQACQGNLDDGIGYCLDYLGVKAVDSRDKLGRERFYPFSPFSFNPGAGKPDQALITSWSDYAVAFKNVNYQDMYALDYLIYMMQPYNAPKANFKKINKISARRPNNYAITKPPRTKPSLTENHVSPYKYLSQNNDNATKAIKLDKLKNQVKQLKELSVLKLF